MKIDPVSGQLLQRISFEGLADNITSVAFGGSDLKVRKNLKVEMSRKRSRSDAEKTNIFDKKERTI